MSSRRSLAHPFSFFGVVSLALAASCGPTAPPPPAACATVVCDAGLVCAEDGLCHCGAATGPTCGAGTTCDAATSTCEPVAVCGAGARWTAGTRAFEEATGPAGLTGVNGVRLAAVDYDGDGWTDVFARTGGGWDDFAPGGARSTWLMRNRGDGTFEDVTEESGILASRQGLPGGRPVDVHAFGDVDNDGDLDVFLSLATSDLARTMNETSEIMLQNEDHTFSLGPEGSAVRFDPLEIETVAGASFIDVDLDGDLDLWTPHHGYGSGGSFTFRQAHLYLNDGTGSFTDGTAAMGLTTADWLDIATINDARAHARAWSGAACDLNDDGYPELLAASYGRAPNHLWVARPGASGVTYENRSVASGYAYDENLTWQDDQFARCFCQANPTAEDCAGVAAPTVVCSPNWDHDTGREPFRLGGNSGTTSCADVDGDGAIDLLTSEIAHWWAGQGSDGAELLVNTGVSDVVFDRPGRASMGIVVPHDDPGGWNEGIMTNAIFDFDADRLPDVFFGMSDYPGNHAVLYHQLGGATLSFEEVPRDVGIDHHRSHGVAVADFDRDGDLDVLLGHSRARCDAAAPDDCYATPQIRLFRNVLGGNFVSLHLVGTTANASAIGARLTVVAGGVTQTHEIDGGHGHYGMQDDLVQHFGLGPECEATVTVRWPVEGLPEETFTLVAGHRYRIEEGAGAPTLEDPI